MPTVISALLAPICLLLALYRVIALPVQLSRGQRRLVTTPSLRPVIWAGLAYAGLVGYMAWLGTRVGAGLSAQTVDSWEVVRLLAYFEAFPLVYVLAESRFFYALDRRSACGQSRVASDKLRG